LLIANFQGMYPPHLAGVD